MTHNFRPIQPLGDRDVYFITSMRYPEKDLGNDVRIEDPPQELENINTPENLDLRPTPSDPHKMDQSTIAPNAQQSNELGVEATTHRSWNPFKNAGGGGGRVEFHLNWFILVSCSSYLAYSLI